MYKIVVYLLLEMIILNCSSLIWASVQDEMDKAQKAGKSVFLVITEPGVHGQDKARHIAEQAQESVASSSVIEMNRADPENSRFIAQYRLKSAPLPLILVVASNGVVTGGLRAAQAKPELLVNMIPSPQKAGVIKALSQRKAAFIVVYKDSMNKDKVLETCQDACKQMNGNVCATL